MARSLIVYPASSAEISKEEAAQLWEQLSVGGAVMAYFANVGGESPFARKMFSIAGLRNLLIHGGTIFHLPTRAASV